MLCKRKVFVMCITKYFINNQMKNTLTWIVCQRGRKVMCYVTFTSFTGIGTTDKKEEFTFFLLHNASFRKYFLILCHMFVKCLMNGFEISQKQILNSLILFEEKLLFLQYFRVMDGRSRKFACFLHYFLMIFPYKY